ncbi:hypothetical protein PIROE2DRAFT_17100 [Piromyces sp. E2]|nr:hypothetical protein PIROE2DRAFT_17100 [Piromyces sp. E2]|eukprot:OUM57801.1 hypothetical protein PIROE2DRAFT_17100 [Piromyces sp. E2]
MRINNFIIILCLLSLGIPFIYADECDKLKDVFEDKSSLITCEVNSQGKINYLNVDDMDLKESDIKKILSYDTITDLIYELNKGADHEHSGYGKIPSFNKLKKLESLIIGYEDTYNTCSDSGYCPSVGLGSLPKNTLKGLNNLKSLTINGIKITQENIDEISTLSNLQSLSFDKCDFSKSINYKSLKSLNKLTKLVLIKSVDGYYKSDGKFPINLVKTLDGKIKDL